MCGWRRWPATASGARPESFRPPPPPATSALEPFTVDRCAPRPRAVGAGSLVSGNRRLAGSLIRGVTETEMLDRCGEHGIVPDVEIVPIQKVNEA